MQSSPLQSVTIIGFDRGFFGERDNDHFTGQHFLRPAVLDLAYWVIKIIRVPSGNIGLAKEALGGDRVSPPTGLSPAFLGLPGWWGAYP